MQVSRSNWAGDFERERNYWNFEYVVAPRNHFQALFHESLTQRAPGESAPPIYSPIRWKSNDRRISVSLSSVTFIVALLVCSVIFDRANEASYIRLLLPPHPFKVVRQARTNDPACRRRSV
jgi:hypothetical protein